MEFNKDKYNLNKLKEMYKGSEEEKTGAYLVIKKHEIDILEDNELVCLHIEYCIDNGFYEESIKLGEEAIKKYPEDTKVQKVIEPILGDKYKNRADKYNQEKRSGGLLDNCCCDACTPCCDCCETCDICIDFGGADTGCCDIGDFCFYDC